MSYNKSIRHECGLFGIFSNERKSLSERVYYGLFALQHRGQESVGISISDSGRISCYKNSGLVSEVFDKSRLDAFPSGNIAIGHVRYATKLTKNIVNAQPLVFSGLKGKFSIANNGRLVNGEEIKSELIGEGQIFQSNTDAEITAQLINKYSDESIVEGVLRASEKMRGGFAFILNTGNELIGVRDRNAVIPLSLGIIDDGYIIASESSAIEAVDGRVLRDIEAGEILVINQAGLKSYHMNDISKSTCIFEMLYLARCDSRIDGRHVYEARFETGRQLARIYNIDADVVAGAPDSGVVSARGYSAESGIPYLDVLSKNRYIGRAFIQLEQVVREKSVRIKLNAIRSNIENKRIILVDDSIVRGTTCKKTVEMLKAAGAKEVHLMVASSPIMHPCYYGVDMTNYDQLIAANHTIEEMCALIGADSVNYLPIDNLIECCGSGGDKGFCTACFTGRYPIQLTKDKE